MIRRLFGYVRPCWERFAVALVCMSLVASLTAITAYLMKEVVDGVFILKDTGMLANLVVVLPVVFILKGIFAYGQNYLMSYIGNRVITDLRNELYDRLQALSLDFYTSRSTGHLMARLTNDVNLLQGAVAHIPAYLIRDGGTALLLTGLLLYLNWRFALIVLVAFPLAMIPLMRLGRKLRTSGRQSQRKMADLYALLQETITGIRIVRAFTMEPREVRRFREQNRDIFNVVMRAMRADALSGPMMELIGALGVTYVIWAGGRDVIQGVWTPGAFFAFVGTVLIAYAPVKNVAGMNSTLQAGLAAAERLFQILDEQPSVTDTPGADDLPPFHHEIQLQDVHLTYPNRAEVLRGVDLTIHRGQIVALVGPSGAGKTSLANLLLRFYDPSSGRIAVDGCDIRGVTVKSLRAQFGLVTQETILFNDTVRNNIGYGHPGATEAEIVEAARAAHAQEFIERLPLGYETIVGERGMLLSGGQQQRIAIARALLKNPPILILDEATSSLDTEAERLVQQALDRLMEHRTVLVIAHRLSTIKRADLILVLDHGRVVETGRHGDLLSHDGLYRRLHDLQFAV